MTSTHPVRKGASLTGAVVLGLGLASPAPADEVTRVRDVIESRRDVLPPAILDTLDEYVGESVLGSQPIYLLIDPRLQGTAAEPANLRSDPTLDGAPLNDDLAAILCRPTEGRSAPVHYQLKRVFRDYLRLFFDDVVDGDSLLEIAQRKRRVQQHDRFVLVAVDAAVSERTADGERRIVTKIWMRLWRVELFDSPPYAVRGVELLYSDRATGSSPIVRPAERTGDEERYVYEAFRAATIDAIRHRLAASLWGRERMIAVPWLDEHADPITTGEAR